MTSYKNKEMASNAILGCMSSPLLSSPPSKRSVKLRPRKTSVRAAQGGGDNGKDTAVEVHRASNAPNNTEATSIQQRSRPLAPSISPFGKDSRNLNVL